MRIAIFDYKVVPNNPVGSCHRRILEALCNEHDFVVFASIFDNPNPARIKFVRVPVPMRPLALTFILYLFLAPVRFWLYRLFGGKKFDAIQVVESNLLLRADIDYSHFCHRRFLKAHWPSLKGKGLRPFLRHLDHWLHTLTEPVVYRRAKRIVVPSRGLVRELSEEYPVTADKITLLANPVDIARMQRPAEFDRASTRAKLGLAENDIVLSFMALGHFERKGLPLLLQAMVELNDRPLKLVVVGGENDLIRSYAGKIADMGLDESRVKFVGMQKDVRPFLWASDAFILPSGYEVFPLVVLEAAAAAVPIIVTPLNGVEEFCRDGVNAIVVQRSVAGIRDGLNRFISLPPDRRQSLGTNAQLDVRKYSVDEFNAAWRNIYQGI